VSTIACTTTPPDGVYVCETDAACPKGQLCVANKCFSTSVAKSSGANQSNSPRSVSVVPESGGAPSIAGSASQTGLAGATGIPQPANVPDAGTASASSVPPSTPPAAVDGGVGISPTPPMLIDCPAGACMPGGKCVPTATDYSCECNAGYSGSGSKLCTNIDDCVASTCGAGGRCIDGIGSYSCDCDPGFSGTGTNACVNIDDCRGNPCSPGECKDGLASYSCTCGAGYSGTGTQRCVDIDDCASDPCAPGGTCRDLGANDYTCNCSVVSPDDKSCPYTLVAGAGGGLYDTTTGLTWLTGYGPYYMTATAADAEDFCATQGGANWRWATLDEVKHIPVGAFSPPELCFFTPSGRYCPPGANPNAETFKVHCVH
jgi:hypothetical protein